MLREPPKGAGHVVDKDETQFQSAGEQVCQLHSCLRWRIIDRVCKQGRMISKWMQVAFRTSRKETSETEAWGAVCEDGVQLRVLHTDRIRRSLCFPGRQRHRGYCYFHHTDAVGWADFFQGGLSELKWIHIFFFLPDSKKKCRPPEDAYLEL